MKTKEYFQMNEEITFYMDSDFMTDSVRIFIGKKQGDVNFVGKIVFEPVERYSFREPTISVPLESDLPEKIKQSLKAMGRLYFADESTIKAKDAHLEDMRRLVFKTGK